MIVDIKSFNAGIAIDAVNGNSISSDAIMEKLLSYIEIYEDRYLSLLLGDSAKDDFVKSINSEEPQARWAKLLAILSKDISPIACYIYFYFVRDIGYQVTGIGVAMEGKSCYSLCSRAWMEMIKVNQKIIDLFASGGYEDVVTDDELLRPIL